MDPQNSYDSRCPPQLTTPHLEFDSAVQLNARPQGRVIRIAALPGDAVVGRETGPTGAIPHNFRALHLVASPAMAMVRWLDPGILGSTLW